MKNSFRILLFFIFLFLINISTSLAEGVENKEYSIILDKKTIAKGYTVEGFGDLKLSLVPGILSSSTPVKIIQLNEKMNSPWNLERISKIYQFEFLNKQAYDNHKPFYIQFAYEKEDDNLKKVYFYDKNFLAWRPLPTQDFPNEKFVRSLIHLPYARIAVFSNPEILTVGRASWYSHKGGDFAASPDFPIGSLIRVFNTANNKYVDVTINDYGPQRSLHPDRVVDLDKVAFGKIASLGDGVIDVRVEPIRVVTAGANEASLEVQAASSKPLISSRAAIVLDEKTEKILYNKNSLEVMPLASLTKLVAIKVFLNTRPDLNRVVPYSRQDELYNYEWCEEWESARLKVDDGETLTIEDLIYSALVGSANNAVESLVRVSGLARPDFIKEMNDTVHEWGASSTRFIEPTGLAPDNVTTAHDYALITKNVFTNPIIQKASTMAEYEFYTVNTKDFHRLKNTNKLITSNKFNIIGSKTGYLNEAGYCLMTRVKIGGGQTIIVVTLGSSDKQLSLDENEILIRYGEKVIAQK